MQRLRAKDWVIIAVASLAGGVALVALVETFLPHAP